MFWRRRVWYVFTRPSLMPGGVEERARSRTGQLAELPLVMKLAELHGRGRGRGRGRGGGEGGGDEMMTDFNPLMSVVMVNPPSKSTSILVNPPSVLVNLLSFLVIP